MIIQGSNAPLIIQTDEPLSDVEELYVALTRAGTAIKTWSKENIHFIGNEAVCPLNEAETQAMEAGVIYIEVKWKDKNGNIYHARRSKTYVSERDDTREMSA